MTQDFSGMTLALKFPKENCSAILLFACRLVRSDFSPEKTAAANQRFLPVFASCMKKPAK